MKDLRRVSLTDLLVTAIVMLAVVATGCYAITDYLNGPTLSEAITTELSKLTAGPGS